MKKSTPAIFLFILMSMFQHVFAQQRAMDSLAVELKKATHDTTRLKIYLAMGIACELKDNLKYADLALGLIDKLLKTTTIDSRIKSLKAQQAQAYQLKAWYYQSPEFLDGNKAYSFYEKQFLIYKEINDPQGVKTVFVELANYHGRNGDLFKQLETLKKGLQFEKELNDKKSMARFIAEIGTFYAGQGDTTEALQYLEMGYELEKKIGDSTRITPGIINKGILFLLIGRYDDAVDCFQLASKRYEAEKDSEGLARCYGLLGDTYKERWDHSPAESLLLKALAYYRLNADIAKAANLDIDFIITPEQQAGNVYRRLRQYDKAVEIHQKLYDQTDKPEMSGYMPKCALLLARDYFAMKNYAKTKYYLGRLNTRRDYFDASTLMEIEEMAAKTDSALGNFKSAYEHYHQYNLFHDKLNDAQVHNAALRERFQIEYEKQKSKDRSEQEKKDALAAIESHKQSLVRNSFMGGFALMLLLAGVSYNGFRRKQRDNSIIIRQKELVEKKNREITDSIEYALRIQTAILPPPQTIKKHLQDSFILYLPKDIVAGDFYWMEVVGDTVLFAACDCTGHGVPGALVSVVCNNALNRAVREFGLTEPAAILDKTAALVIDDFSKSEAEIKDGMDVSLLSIRSNGPAGIPEVQWAGANNPLWIISNGMLREIKGDKQPIGKAEEVKSFTNHRVDLMKGDGLYLFTDGFADQFSSGDKKLTRKKFKELLLDINSKPMDDQRRLLNEFITAYRGTTEQTDDVLVMGVRI